MTPSTVSAHVHALLPADSVDPSARVPGPPNEAERARRRPTPMWQALLLAALLHLWLALLLGNVPPGSAAPGEGLWGAINLRLQGHDPAGPEAAVLPPPAPLPLAGPPGDAPTPRAGGVVREQAPSPQATPGAAQRGDWAARPALPAAPPTAADLPAAVRAPDVDPRWPEVADLPALSARPDPAPLRVPPAPAAVVRPALPGTPSAATLPPLDLPALPTPVAAPAPVLAPLSPQLPPPIPEQRAPLLPLAAVPGVATMPQLQALPALAMPDAPAARLAPAPDLQRADRPLPPLTATDASTPLPNALPLTRLPDLGAAAAARPAPPGAQAAQTAQGRPDAGSTEGADVATPPSAPASAPRLNLQLPRARGGELSRLGSSGLLPVLPRPPEVKSKLAQEIEGAANKDCRTAHANLGLLAVVPLAMDALKKDGGCRW